MTIKRTYEVDNKDVENLAMANCLMLLNRVGQSGTSPGRVFNCKTCNKTFNSFQALGGHRASHKRPKTDVNDALQTPVKPKTHECSVCGLEFAIGQALGGHMRRHRDVGSGDKTRPPVTMEKRGLCLELDLNLTPYENDVLWSRRVNTALAM
ncbi:hypothetical protein QVD17_17588 [Tagetes erecta]|uniref:C2H2-type domain-containing protein n=1 Tax=Tagetes erecta TaxID=13708 RepID=A0AAD8P0E5_TARER|nr:hypothetical protein QVD17_17588 [Tagetes erecta]